MSSLDGTVFLEKSTIVRNHGGISALGTGTLILKHCEIRGNDAGSVEVDGVRVRVSALEVDEGVWASVRSCTGDDEARRKFALYGPKKAEPKPNNPPKPIVAIVMAPGVGPAVPGAVIGSCASEGADDSGALSEAQDAGAMAVAEPEVSDGAAVALPLASPAAGTDGDMCIEIPTL